MQTSKAKVKHLRTSIRMLYKDGVAESSLKIRFQKIQSRRRVSGKLLTLDAAKSRRRIVALMSSTEIPLGRYAGKARTTKKMRMHRGGIESSRYRS